MSTPNQFHSHVVLVTHGLSSRIDLETELSPYHPRAIFPITDNTAIVYIPLTTSCEDYRDQLKKCPLIQDSRLVTRG